MKTFKELTEEIRLDESAGNTVFTLADFKKIPISGRPGHDMKPTYSVNANYVRIDISTLGGQHRPILGIKLSLDDKEDWENDNLISEDLQELEPEIFEDSDLNPLEKLLQQIQQNPLVLKNSEESTRLINEITRSLERQNGKARA